MFGGECNCDFRFAISSKHRAEMSEWISKAVPTVPGVFLIHFADRFGGAEGNGPAGHFLGWAVDCRAELLALLAGRDRETKFSHIVNVANSKGIKWHPARIWQAPSAKEAEGIYKQMKGRGAFIRKCPECR